MMKLKAAELRTSDPTEEQIKNIKKNEIYIICDSVLDTYNVGAIFRLADATTCKKVFLCGQTETPPNSRIKKASVSTWKWVDWQYLPSAKSAIKNLKLKIKNLRVIAIEQSPSSIPYEKADYKMPIALVVGNETSGISEEVLNMADEIVELPMLGINTSLNVMVSLGIILYKVIEKIK